MAKPKANGKSRGRKSKAESMTGKKENAAEMRKASELDLQAVVIDDDDFNLHFRSTKNAKERLETANSLYRSCLKNAKKVSEALHDAIKTALKYEGMDPADIKAQMEISGYVLRKTGSSVQLTIHDTLLGDVKEQAYKRGNDDAKNGRTANCSYPDGSDLAESYMAGWRNGIAANLSGKKDERPAKE